MSNRAIPLLAIEDNASWIAEQPRQAVFLGDDARLAAKIARYRLLPTVQRVLDTFFLGHVIIHSDLTPFISQF